MSVYQVMLIFYMVWMNPVSSQSDHAAQTASIENELQILEKKFHIELQLLQARLPKKAGETFSRKVDLYVEKEKGLQGIKAVEEKQLHTLLDDLSVYKTTVRDNVKAIKTDLSEIKMQRINSTQKIASVISERCNNTDSAVYQEKLKQANSRFESEAKQLNRDIVQLKMMINWKTRCVGKSCHNHGQ